VRILRGITREYLLVMIANAAGRIIVRMLTRVRMMVRVIENPAEGFQFDMRHRRTPDQGEQNGEDCAGPQHRRILV
jgi:hypothetical protein